MMKGFLYLLIYGLIGQLTFAEWSEWSSWSSCSRSCDGGATYRQRKCSGERSNACEGESTVYKTCHNEPCPSGSPSFRAEQCTAYDEIPVRGNIFTWLPYYDRIHRCALRCKATGFNFVVTLAPRVLDGTRCDEQGRDMCIDGKCVKVGCDKELESHADFDECGVCGGDGKSCLPSQISPPAVEWELSEFNSCSVTCGVGVKHSAPICTDTATRGILDPAYCSHLTPPESVKKKCIKSRCIVPEWVETNWGPCSRSCSGGVRRRNVDCFEETANGNRKRVPADRCLKPRSPSSNLCNTERCPTWYAGEWSPCTTTCDEGSQYREVICRQMSGQVCEETTKPQVVRNCPSNLACESPTELLSTSVTAPIIQLQEEDSSWETEIGEDRQEMKIAQQNAKHKDGNLNFRATTSPSFVVSTWSTCGVTCGTGVKTRSVLCQVYLKYLDKTDSLPDIDCDGKKPSGEKWCYAGTCNSTNNTQEISWTNLEDEKKAYSWRYGNFTPCSKSCLRGRQDSMVNCVRNLDGTVINTKFCSSLPGLHTISRVCNDIACPPRWEMGGFGRCSAKCGGGVSRRSLRCIQQMAPGESNVVMVEEKLCGKNLPETEKTCNEHPCPAKWRTGKWSQCSLPCGTGLQTRDVICERLILHNHYSIVPEVECPGEEKPVKRRWCVTDCTYRKPKIRTQNSTFIQFTSTKKIVLKVGGNALILPGATVVVRCPVKRYNRKLIVWYRHGNVVAPKGRVKVLKSGALRIRKAKLYKDAGKYTCVASAVNASIEIQFQTKTEAKEKAKIRQKYLDTISHSQEFNKLFKQSLKASNSIPWENQPGIVKDESYGEKTSQTMFVAGQWSPCSKSCGGEGFQQRKVTCEEISTGYTRIMTHDMCTKLGLKPPESERHCFTGDSCPKWATGEWSPCSLDDCVRDGYSLQSRDVLCSFPNGSTAKSIHCYPQSRPVNRQECSNRDCLSVWETSAWSECIPPCSGAGKKTRMLFCVWDESGFPAGINCRKKPQPEIMKPCKTTLCSLGNCHDDSKHCSLVKMLRMCKYDNFKRRCCKTCSDF